MSWPAIIMIGLAVFSIGYSIVNEGKSKPDWSFTTSFFTVCIEMGLLYWGGFFQ